LAIPSPTHAVAAPAPGALQPQPPPPAAAAPSRPPRRSGGEEKESARRKRRIKTLEERIAGLEKEIEKIEARLWEEDSPPGPVESTRLLDEKRVKQGELDALVEEWAALSEQEERPEPSPQRG
jgi:hypothetical protein